MQQTIPLNITERIQKLEGLIQQIRNAKSQEEKLNIISSDPEVLAAEHADEHLKQMYPQLIPEQCFALKSLLAIGQGELLKNIELHPEQLNPLLCILDDLESVYDAIGGILGYHLTLLQLIKDSKKQNNSLSNLQFFHPPGFNIEHMTQEVREAIYFGLMQLSGVAEIYPVGGAGDRLDLHDDVTGEALPAAELKFIGRTLLEGLIRDLQAREYLHFKLFGSQLQTPIALMTSHEKNNDAHVKAICQRNSWFGRNPENFRFFIQPLVPVVTVEGQWVSLGPLSLMLKPGGHGVIWKLAVETGVFDWLLSKNYVKALVRQINNPMAGIDYGLSAFIGIGMKDQKCFGFASCPRRLNATEGMDVLIAKRVQNQVEYSISNIEYTEFEKLGIKDEPTKPGGDSSLFPANTNILFVDLEQIKEAASACPIPGMLINMKTRVKLKSNHGEEVEVEAGRLESTMQNIADYIVDRIPEGQLPDPIEAISSQKLRTYITYNKRHKTISVCKKSYKSGGSISETPEGCFYELLENCEELLTRYCHVKMPSISSQQEYLKRGPNFIVILQPALGPLYSVIAQKIQRGVIHNRSEMLLEIAELELVDFEFQGSLIIEATDPLGRKGVDQVIRYGNQAGKASLRNVKIKNAGIDWEQSHAFWKNNPIRKEVCHIILKGNAEFHAENVTLEGNHFIEVEDGMRLVAYEKDGKVAFRKEKLEGWYWSYHFDNHKKICLSKSYLN